VVRVLAGRARGKGMARSDPEGGTMHLSSVLNYLQLWGLGDDEIITVVALGPNVMDKTSVISMLTVTCIVLLI